MQQPTRPSKFDVIKFMDNLLRGIQEGRLAELVTAEQIRRLNSQAKLVFRSQPMFLQVNAPMVVCGDVHGQFNDVMRIFDSEGFPNERNYLFLGDYVDRGLQSVELILFLLACKVRYPKNFFMLRGNHETSSVNRAYGFHDQVMDKYQSESLYESFQEVFNWMPLSALISKRILCMHGGLSPEMTEAKSLEQLLNGIRRPLTDQEINARQNSLAVNILWADPDINVNKFASNRRGIGYTFGQTIIDQVRKRYGLDLILRAHQVVLDGCEFFNNRMDSGLVTLFSAPHYESRFDNAGAIAIVDDHLSVSFKIFKPQFQAANGEERSGHHG